MSVHSGGDAGSADEQALRNMRARHGQPQFGPVVRTTRSAIAGSAAAGPSASSARLASAFSTSLQPRSMRSGRDQQPAAREVAWTRQRFACQLDAVEQA